MPALIRFTIQLPKHFERKLRLWAKYKGQSRAGLSAHIIQSRIEDNWADVQRHMEILAKREGLTLEELEAKWLDEADAD